MILTISNLKKGYGNKNNYQLVLNNINLKFKSGEFVCLLGESGSGKSTLLNIIGGLDSKYDGDVFLDEYNLKYIDKDLYRKENIGFVFQNFNLINSISIIDNIMLPIDKYDISYKEKKEKVINLLKKLNIYNIRNNKINDLSGGQKQRVAIARALINDPQIILCDEPTGALDEKNSESVLEILKEINKEGKLVIVVTHSRKVIKYSTRIIKIKDGKIYNDKKVKNIKETNIKGKYLKENNYLYLVKYGIRNFFNNFKRNIFIILASSIGIIGIILSLFIGDSSKNYIKKIILDKTNPYIYNINSKDMDIYSSKTYDIDEINKIKNIKHIKKIYKSKTYDLSKMNIDNNEYNLSYIDAINNIDILKGNSNGLVINKKLADKINKDNNKVINKNISISLVDNYKIINFETKISGISKDSNLSLVDDTYHAYIKYKNIEKIYDDNAIKLRPSNLSIKIDNKDNIKYIKNKLNKMNLVISNNDELYKELNSYLSIATFILSLFSSTSLIVSTIMISIIININVIERIKEIGLLRSIGYSKKNIKYIFNSEAFILGLIIGLFSSSISKIIINIICNIINNKFNLNFSLTTNKYYIIGILISIIVIMISTYIPSKKASNYDPVYALKYE